jgi:AcrR family transcriptional regulator
MPKIVDRDRYRKELLNKCFDLFAEKGYSSLTIRQVATEIGVSTGTLYHYFASKEELFSQLIEEITEHDILLATKEINGENLETIEQRVLALGRFIAKNERLFYKQNLLLMNFSQQIDSKQLSIVEAIKHSSERYQQEIMKFLRVDDPAIANHVSCFIDGLIYQRAFSPKTVEIDRQVKLLALMLDAYMNNA